MATSMLWVKLPSVDDDCQPMAAMAPWLMDRDGSGMISSGANSILKPRPWQTGQAPKGLLNEKLLGSISSKLMPQSGQEKLWLKVR